MDKQYNSHFDAIDPENYLNLKKSDILFKLKYQLGCSDEKAEKTFCFMIKTVAGLKPLRIWLNQTEIYVSNAISNISPKTRMFTINFLLKSFKDADSYSYAHNSLAHYFNLDSPVVVKLKKVPDHIIMAIAKCTNDLPTQSPVDNHLHPSEKPSMKEVALKYAWENKTINHQNMEEVARIYGFNSGMKLYRCYIEVMKRSDRIANPDTSKRALIYKIKLFEKAGKIVAPEFKNIALEEINILVDILKNEYL